MRPQDVHGQSSERQQRQPLVDAPRRRKRRGGGRFRHRRPRGRLDRLELLGRRAAEPRGGGMRPAGRARVRRHLRGRRGAAGGDGGGRRPPGRALLESDQSGQAAVRAHRRRLRGGGVRGTGRRAGRQLRHPQRHSTHSADARGESAHVRNAHHRRPR